MIHTTSNLLPENKPRYLMGVGYPIDILNAVKNGVDMFDCVLPLDLEERFHIYLSWSMSEMLNTQ